MMENIIVLPLDRAEVLRVALSRVFPSLASTSGLLEHFLQIACPPTRFFARLLTY
jgi:hypothetical protein